MKQLKELSEQVEQWAQEKGLLDNVTSYIKRKQTLKVLEEIGETTGAFLKENRADLIDGIGDIAVTIIILAAMHNHELSIDIEGAYSMGSDKDLFDMVDSISIVFSTGDPYELDIAMSTLVLFTMDFGLDIEDCLQSAYDVISKRTGKMVNGTFIKDN